MASAAYLALLVQPSVRWVVLAEITAREALHGWASAGSGAYSVTWDTYTHPTNLRLDRGLYRELLGVWENGTALTLRASVAAVQANPGSYYYDAATSTLTIETSGSVNPDTLASVQAVFTVRVATEPMNFSDRPPYDAQIDGETLPSLRMEWPELLRGIVAFPSGDFTLVNADGFWDYPAAAWIWTNATVAFLAGAPSLAYSEFEPQTTMQVSRAPAAGDTQAVFQLRSRMNATNRAFPQRTVEDYYGPSVALLADVDPAQPLPVWWGAVVDAPLVFVGDNGTKNKWIPGDPLILTTVTYASLTAIEKATGTRTLLAGGGTDYLVLGGADRAVDVSKTYDPVTYDVVATMSQAAQTCGAIASAILAACDVSAAEIASATFTQADADNPATLGLWVGVRPNEDRVAALRTGIDLLNLLERSCTLSVYIAPSGLWTAKVWDPSFTWSGLTIRTDADLFRVAPVTGVTMHPVASVAVRYNRAIYGDTWSSVSASSDEAARRLNADETETIETCLAVSTDAAVLAGRLLAVGQQEPLEIAIEDGATLLTFSPGDKIRLQRNRGASKTGAVDQPMEVLAITKNLAGMTVAATIGNQRGLGALVKLAAGDAVANWASASADERLQYAYACDDNGLVDAADGTSYRQAVSW